MIREAEGDFVWHITRIPTRLSLCLEGPSEDRFSRGAGHVEAGESSWFAKGVEHKPAPNTEVHKLLLISARRLNTGPLRAAIARPE